MLPGVKWQLHLRSLTQRSSGVIQDTSELGQGYVPPASCVLLILLWGFCACHVSLGVFHAFALLYSIYHFRNKYGCPEAAANTPT